MIVRRLRIRLLAAAVAATLLGAPVVQGAQPPPPGRPFQSEDWDLAWQAFIGSGAVDDAYVLARSAVRARPRSHLWWTRLAQAALWSGRPQAALDAQAYLALDLGEKSHLQPALKLATELENDQQSLRLIRTMIRDGLATPAQRGMLADLYMATGQPDQAVQALARQYRRHPNPDLLWRQASILRQMGQPAQELAVLRAYRKRYGPVPRVMLAIATREYLSGQPQAALDTLLQAQARATPGQTAYWNTLSGLAWMLGRYRLAARSARILIEHGKADATLYLRVVYVEQYTQPEQAFAVAERGWKATRDPALFQAMLAIASSRQPATPWLKRAFAALAPDQVRRFADQPFYWTSLATLRAAQGRFGDAQAAYLHALRLAPRDNTILAGYLWLHLDHRNVSDLRAALGRLARRAMASSSLWGPLAALYAALDQPQRALPWLQRQWPGHRNDPLWLVNLADVLDQADRNAAAWRVRRRALDLLGNPPIAADATAHEMRIARTRLIASLRPGDAARKAMQQLAREDRTRAARVAVLGGLLDARDLSLARWWREGAFAHQALPDWAALSLALADNDGVALADLLRNKRGRLPRRDRVDAATRLGWDPLALKLAWQGMQGEPDDARLQRQFREIALPRTDSIGISAAVRDASGLRSLPFTLTARDWTTPRDRLDLKTGFAPQRSIDARLIGPPPSSRRSLVLAWTHLTERGEFETRFGTGRNLAPWTRLGMAWTRRWSNALQSTIGVQRGAQPTDTVPLEVAGLEDRVDLDASLNLSPRDTAQWQLTAARLRAQGGGALGSVQKAALSLDHKLWFTPPDFTLTASVSAAHFHRATRLPAQLAPLIPTGQTPDIGYFVPASYAQACAGGSFNMRYQTGYAGQWRPYASASACTNSAYGTGYELQAGIALPVTGPDHLSLSLALGRSVGPQQGTNASVVLRYRYYFSSPR